MQKKKRWFHKNLAVKIEVYLGSSDLSFIIVQTCNRCPTDIQKLVPNSHESKDCPDCLDKGYNLEQIARINKWFLVKGEY